MNTRKKRMTASLGIASLVIWSLVFISLIEQFPTKQSYSPSLTTIKEMGSVATDTLNNRPFRDPFHWVQSKVEKRPTTRAVVDNTKPHHQKLEPSLGYPIKGKAQKKSIDFHGVIASGKQHAAIIKIGEEWSTVGNEGQGRYWFKDMQSASLIFKDSSTGELLIVATPKPLCIRTLDSNPPTP